MALIEKELKRERVQLRVRLDRALVEQLDAYCRFIESGRDFVIESLLGYGFRKDREFQRWLSNPPLGEQKPIQTRRRNRGMGEAERQADRAAAMGSSAA